VYANEVNLLGEKINTRKKNTKALLDASNKVKAEKIRNVCLAARMQDKITTQRELTNPLKMWLIQMFGNDTRNKNLIHKEIKYSLNLQEACYHLVHNLFLTCYLSV
jgi:pyrimidine operon attenuation protein/uracil phosphoribosyltransferase